MLARQAWFRAAADLMTDALARFAEVEAVALIGSVARLVVEGMKMSNSWFATPTPPAFSVRPTSPARARKPD